MKFLRKLKARRKGEINMTPLPKKMLQGIVIFDKEADKKARIISKEIKELAEESYSPDLIEQFEKENPGKHAMWRGSWTKQFTTWVKNVNTT